MFNNVNAITACVNMEHNLDVQKTINDHVNTVGCHHVYVDGDKVYVGFETKSTVTEVAKIIEEKLHGVSTKIVGGVVFVKFK